MLDQAASQMLRYMRLIRLTDTDANGKLLYGDILNFMEKKGYLADDLQSITSEMLRRNYSTHRDAREVL